VGQLLAVNLNQVNLTDVPMAGGKGASLGDMSQQGVPVPPGFIVTTNAYRKYEGHVPDDFAAQLYRYFDELGADRVAVRSSAIAEDAPTHSWAGQFDSYLNVERKDLISRVEDCWKSVSFGQAYAIETGTGQADLAMAVVVQKMVQSEVSGVAFSVNPISKVADEIVIEGIYGLGELLVQGMVTPDHYVVSKSSHEILTSAIATKERMLDFRDGINSEVDVPREKVEEPCLTDAQIRELSLLVAEVENHFGSPQDIEWAFENGSFYIVQSRTITTL
jgi:phosphoenolpyruvate synthase/pyruvate phosphate dikinase